MRDNEIFTLLRTILLAAIGDDPAVAVKQAFLPVTMGADTGPTLYMSTLFDKAVGSPSRRADVDPDTLDMLHREAQVLERHMQITAVARQGLGADEWTAKDYANLARRIMASDTTRAALKVGGLGILRVTDIRDPKSLNQSDQFEAFPSFDFVLTDEDEHVTRIPAIIGPPELQIARV